MVNCNAQTLECFYIPLLKEASQDIACITKDQLYINVVCGFSNGTKIASLFAQVYSYLQFKLDVSNLDCLCTGVLMTKLALRTCRFL